ncbi:MAG: hypothetical protein HZA46_13000 [Planctomycetales bacterium]|nr:hypothetical protein [Planctomycetales bacterium]
MTRLAQWLVTCEDASLRDPHRAAELAQQATRLSPDSAAAWSALGSAQFRSDDCLESLKSFARATELGTTETGLDAFWISLVHARLDDQPAARSHYEVASKFVRDHCLGRRDLLKLQHETSKVLSIIEPAAPPGKP